MSDQLKVLPALVMLLAGAVTSICTYCIGYSSKSALLILLFVLIVFYILGLVLQRVIYKFELANEAKTENVQEEPAEGKVVEKDESQINKSTENGNLDAGNRPELDR